jgi:hypothetical protein
VACGETGGERGSRCCIDGCILEMVADGGSENESAGVKGWIDEAIVGSWRFVSGGDNSEETSIAKFNAIGDGMVNNRIVGEDYF